MFDTGGIRIGCVGIGIHADHCKGCDMCEAYTLHVIEASKVLMVEILPRDVKKALQIAWPNIVCHIEDDVSCVRQGSQVV